MISESIFDKSEARRVDTDGLLVFVRFTEGDDQSVLVISILCLTLFFRNIALWIRTVYVVSENTRWFPKFETILRSGEAVIGVVLLSSGFGLIAVSLLHLLAWIVDLIVVAIKLKRDHADFLKLGLRWKYLRLIISISLFFCLSATAASLFPQILVIASRNLGYDASLVGNLALAMQFFNTLIIVPMTMSRSFMPWFSRSQLADRGRFELIIVIKALTIISVAGAILGASLGPWFIEFVFSSKYTVAGSIFGSLCAAFPLFALVSFSAPILNVMDRRYASVFIFFGMILCQITVLVLSGEDGSLWVITGSLLVPALLGSVISMIVIENRLQTGESLWWIKTLLIAAIAPLTVYAFELYGKHWAPAALIVLVLMVFATGIFNKDENIFFAGYMRKILGRFKKS